jgi:hypothetical protein
MALVGGLVAVTLWPASAPGTVAEQRARLPAPAECTDPVVGIWQSHRFDELYQQWEIFTLTIRRDEDSGMLDGEITNHAWDGDARQSEPPPCHGAFHGVVKMEAEGTFDEGWVEFWGIEWEVEEILCGWFPGYNLDHFSGQIDYDLQEFQSVNNDGGRAVNTPTVFRRIDCLDPPPEPTIEVSPPPLFPEGDRPSGCLR